MEVSDNLDNNLYAVLTIRFMRQVTTYATSLKNLSSGYCSPDSLPNGGVKVSQGEGDEPFEKRD